MGGDKAAHDEMVLAGARELAKDVEIVVLAQASMSRLQPSLEEESRHPSAGQPADGHPDAGRRCARCAATVTAELLDGREPVPAGSLFGWAPAGPGGAGRVALIRAENERTGTRIAVVGRRPDRHPDRRRGSGAHLVGGLRPQWAMDAGAGTFFVLTNTRGWQPSGRPRANAEIAANLETAAKAAGGARVRLSAGAIRRCGATTRWRPTSTSGRRGPWRAVPRCAVQPGLPGRRPDHRQRRALDPPRRGTGPGGQHRVRAGRDVRLPQLQPAEFVAEKTDGRSAPRTSARCTSTRSARGGPEAVRDVLLGVRGGQPVIVNAVEEQDLEVVCSAVQLGRAEGRRSCTAAGLRWSGAGWTRDSAAAEP